MSDRSKTRQELTEEIALLKKRISELEEKSAGQKQAELALRESEDRFRLLYERAPIGYQSLDEDGAFVEVNQAWLDTLGYSLDEVIGKSFGDFLHPDCKDHFKENFPRFKAVGEILGAEFEMIKRDGSIILVSFNGRIGKDKDGNFQQTHCVLNDITERRRAEERMALRQRELNEINQIGLIANSSLDLNVVLKLILQSATKAVNASVGMIFLKEPGSGCLTWGASIGLSEEFIHDFKNKPIQVGEGLTGTIAKTGKPIFILKESSRDHRIVRSVIRKEGLHSFLGVPIIADEEIVGVMNIVTRPPEQLSEQDVPFCAALGSQVGLAIRNAHLYTAQKKAEEVVREREELLSGILENLQDAYFRADLSGRFIFVNATAPQMYGYYSGEQLIGRSVQELYADSGAREALLNELRRYGAVKDWVTRGLRADGSAFWVSMNARFIRDSDGKVIGTEGVVRDITRRKRAETYREIGREILQILNEPGDLQESIQRVLATLKTQTGVDAVGLRLQEGEDFPYFAQDGFSKDFLLTENTLIERSNDGGLCRDEDGNVKLECNCGLVISGKTDPSNPLFTQGGSCWTNESFPLLDLPSDQDPRLHPRNNCIHQGYASVALIPVRTRDRIVGLIQLNDKRKDRFTLEAIEILEGIAAHIGSALMRRRAEEALRQSEETHRALVEGLPDTVMRFDRSGRHLFVSDNVSEKVDLEAAQFIGKTHAELGFPEGLCRFWEESIRRVFDSGAPFETEFTAEGKSGPVIFNWRLIPERNAQGAVSSVLSISRDITAHLKAEQEYETLFREMLEGFALHEIILDAAGTPVDYRFLAVNPAFERMTGLDAIDIIGRTLLEVLPATERYWIETYGKVALTGKPVSFENYSSEIAKYFEVTAFCPATGQFACIFQDITGRKLADAEREKLQEQLQQAQKMEAIGTLAGGIAHDFNNILSAVMGYSEMAQAELPRESDAGRYIDQVLQASNRAKDLVKQILAFSRHSDEDMKPLKAGLLLKEAVKLLRASLPSTIEMKTDISASRDTILANATQIHQVIMNLCTNAFHAMHDSGGVLDLSLSEVEMDGKAAAEDMHLSAGSYLLLAVSDTGCGMSPEIVERIFDPYFTTKEKDVGTGLGLSVVHGIVKRHGGDVRVWSEPGKGTEFHVLIPVLEGGEIVFAEAHRDLPKGTGRILFVDDEVAIADIGMRMLSRQGYHVEIKTSSIEALELFRSRPYDFDLLITDMTMPHLRGDALARAVMEIRPDIPVILCTGYSDMIDEEKARETGIRCVLMKPVGLSELAQTVYYILSGKDPGRGEG